MSPITPSPAKDEIKNVRADALRRRSALQNLLAGIAKVLSHPWLFLRELLVHVPWIALNTGLVAGVRAWDPCPFSLLTGLDPLQALFIGLLILMYAQQESRAAEVREEMDLQVALHSEREMSKLIRMLTEVHRSLGVRTVEHDRALEVMIQPLDREHLERKTEEHLQQAEEEP